MKKLIPAISLLWSLPIALFPGNAAAQYGEQISLRSTAANAKPPVIGQKTNLLYWATGSPNFGIEFSVGRHWSINALVGYNPWHSGKNNASLRHWLVTTEVRYWQCRTFEGHFFGAQAIYGRYNLGQISFLGSELREYTFRGYGYGAGVSYGYHFPLGLRWGLELVAGVGYLKLNYDKYRCVTCAEHMGSFRRNYFGPTKAGVTLIYMLR